MVKILVNEVQVQRPDGFVVEWDGRNDSGNPVSSGVYFLRLRAPGFEQTRKIMILK
jgi:hypothetical protein